MEKNGTTQNHNATEKNPSYRKYIILVVLFPLLIIAALVFIWFTQEDKPDPASEKIIREATAAQLKKDPNNLTDDDFAKITSFSIGSRELSDIKMLEKFKNLQYLRLENIRFSDKNIPTWMKILTKFGIYDPKERFVIDLSPLKNLIHLGNLYLNDIPVINIKPLSGLTELKQLTLTETQISNIESMSNLVELEELNISNTQVFNLEPIKNLPRLRTLICKDTPILDIKPLHGFTNLLEFQLTGTQVSDLAFLEGFSNLAILDLGSTPVSDLEPIKGLTELRGLSIQDCKNITAEQVEDLQKALPKLDIVK